MTAWGIAEMWLGLVAYAVALQWGGRAERVAAAILLLHCLAAVAVFKWRIDGLQSPRMVIDCIRTSFFVWFCLRSQRWWIFVPAAVGLIKVGLHAATLREPAFFIAAASAGIGLEYLVDLTLLLSVCERVMAGEPPARHAAWARADIATAARRRKKVVRRPDTGFARLWKARTTDPRPRPPRLTA